MSKLSQRPSIECSVTLMLTEREMRALDALVGYGVKPFLKVFYEHMGRHYLEPHEAGLVSLFDTIRGELPPILTRAQAARTAFALQNPIIKSREQYSAAIAEAVESGARAARAEQAPTGDAK